MGLGLLVLLGGDGAEEFLDLRLHVIYVYVTHHNDCLVAGIVPGMVEINYALVGEGLQMLLGADEGVESHRSAFSEVDGKGSLHSAPGSVTPGTALLNDDSAFCINLRGLVENVVGIVPEDHQAAVHYGLAGNGDVIEHILGLLETGGCVDVASEFRTYGAEVVKDGLSGEIGGAVEAHVLKEVGKTVLGRILFLDGAHVGSQIELCPLCGELVLADVVGETVVQLSDPYLLGVGNLGHLGDHRLKLFSRLRESTRRCCDGECNSN